MVSQREARPNLVRKNKAKAECAPKGSVSQSEGNTKGRVKKSFYMGEGEARRAFKTSSLMLLLIYKEPYVCFTNSDPLLPVSISFILYDYNDVLTEDIPSGLPPIRGIEHQIDFVPGVVIPNRPAYRSNPE